MALDLINLEKSIESAYRNYNIFESLIESSFRLSLYQAQEIQLHVHDLKIRGAAEDIKCLLNLTH